MAFPPRLLLAAFALWSGSASAFSAPSASRRTFFIDLARVGLGGASLVVAEGPARAAGPAQVASFDFGVDPSGKPQSTAAFAVPGDWKQLSDSRATVSGGRRLVVYADPTDNDVNCFLLITPVRGDYTSLGSFGSLDTVADTVVPAGEGITSKLLSSSSSSGKYTYEYVVTVPNQPTRHMETVFALASDNIVTFTTQTLEAKHENAKGPLAEVLKSFAILKKDA